jgi:hypothetical protein
MRGQVCLSACLSACLSVCLSVCLSACMHLGGSRAAALRDGPVGILPQRVCEVARDRKRQAREFLRVIGSEPGKRHSFCEDENEQPDNKWCYAHMVSPEEDFSNSSRF